MPVGHLLMFFELGIVDAFYTHICTGWNCMRIRFKRAAVLLNEGQISVTCQQYTQKRKCPTLSCSKCSSCLALLHSTMHACNCTRQPELGCLRPS